MSNTEKPTLYCSFCGKSQHNVRKLVAGPKVFICDECIVLCMEVITEAELKTGSSYGKFLDFHKKRPTSLEKFNTFFGTKSPAERTEETTKKIVDKLDEIHNRLTGIVNKMENQ